MHGDGSESSHQSQNMGSGATTARYRQGCLPAEEPETTDRELQAPPTDVQKPESGPSWLLWD
jgi:hypothetical protein